MPITPGECGFTIVAGVTIPTCPPFTAKDCILVNKVYDQCFAEELGTSGTIPLRVVFPCIDIPPGSTVGCIPIPGSATCTFAGTVAVTPPLTPFFEEVLVLNSFEAVAPIFSPAGVTLCAHTVTISAAARANLWAPPGTSITCDIVSFGDCSCTLLTSPTGLPIQLACVGNICKELQVTAPVKLLVPTYGFCEVPACTFSAEPGFACLPQPLFPPERCQLPPTVTILAVGGAPLVGTTVTVTRLIGGVPTVVATAVTDITGTAAFPTIGGLEGALDTVSFVSGGVKVVSFPIPIEFTDVLGVAHDSATACSLLFAGVAVLLNTYTVTVNGFLLGSGTIGVPALIDP